MYVVLTKNTDGTYLLEGEVENHSDIKTFLNGVDHRTYYTAKVTTSHEVGPPKRSVTTVVRSTSLNPRTPKE